MADWKKFVASRLGSTGLPLEREQEIVEELATHLQDVEPEGAAGEQVRDWPAFARQIRLAEEDSMKSRLRTLWIPGLVTGMLSVLVLRAVQYADLRPIVVRLEAMPMVFYLPWLFTLPLVGAVGAYLSRKAGATAKTRTLAAIFPSVALGAVIGLSAVAAVVGALFTGESLLRLGWLMAQFIAVWIILPAAALALGALPFLRTRKGSGPDPSEVAHA